MDTWYVDRKKNYIKVEIKKDRKVRMTILEMENTYTMTHT